MTSLDEHSFHVHSIGKQVQSQRQAAGIYTLSKVGRDQREKMFISHEASRIAGLGRESPEGGHVYNIPSTLNLKTGVAFATGKAVDEIFQINPEAGIDSNAELGILPDSQKFKYGRDATILIGTEPKGRLKDAELIKNHSAAFFGKESPGPAAIGDTYGPKWQITKKRLAGAAPFAGKLAANWQKTNNQPDNVGPGLYTRKDVCIGKQHLSHRRNQPGSPFGRAPKFEKTTTADTVSQVDAAKSSNGKQVLSRNRSEPSVGFGCGTRDRRSRTTMCITNQDLGPKAFMPKPFHSMPRLPMEREIMKSGWSGIGTS